MATKLDIRRNFLKVLVNSMDTPQVNHLGEMLDGRFNIYKISGFNDTTPLPRRTAAEVLVNHFDTEEKIVELFTIMMNNDGMRFYNATLNVWGKDEFIRILRRYKWIYDPSLNRFFLDPFYEHEINLLRKLRLIDLREAGPLDEIIREVEKASTKLSLKDLEWRISMRLYDLEPKIGELTKNIIRLLLARQNLQALSDELFFCLKELATNASKANYKLLFERSITRPRGVSQEKDYFHFLRLFRDEIDEYGNERLLRLARQHDRFITLTFQSSRESIEMWVTNNENISLIEKQALLKKLGMGGFRNDSSFESDDDYAEGAGFGLNMILSILKSFTREQRPLQVVFYPDFIKIGFELSRSDLHETIERKSAASEKAGEPAE
ncbi:MAG: hypothetical protein JW838_08665 [Spirochaetes bacterium]|nr:hypothetical protein [Spirochaetota bacterium]